MNGEAEDTGPSEPDAVLHRRLAVELFNRAWLLLEREPRTAAEDVELLHVAHASRLHWQDAGGTAAHLARGEWLCGRVYAVLGHAEAALRHAGQALALVDEGGAGFADWDRAAALQGMAHASLAAGDTAAARDWAARARKELGGVDDPEDRAVIERQLARLGLEGRSIT